MKTTKINLLLMATAIAFAFNACKMGEEKKQTETHDSTAVQGAHAMYVCPMHPEEKSDKPGKCSKCGMDLEKKAE